VLDCYYSARAEPARHLPRLSRAGEHGRQLKRAMMTQAGEALPSYQVGRPAEVTRFGASIAVVSA